MIETQEKGVLVKEREYWILLEKFHWNYFSENFPLLNIVQQCIAMFKVFVHKKKVHRHEHLDKNWTEKNSSSGPKRERTLCRHSIWISLLYTEHRVLYFNLRTLCVHTHKFRNFRETFFVERNVSRCQIWNFLNLGLHLNPGENTHNFFLF